MELTPRSFVPISFSPPQQMLAAFDVVVSFGVAEHFEDTTAYLTAASQFLKPGGTLVTSIPNMVGWIGALLKATNKPVYDIHELLDPAVLMEAHALAGLDVLECDYFLFTSFGVSSLTGVSMSTVSGFLKKVCVAILARVSMLAWFVEDKISAFPANRLTSPYINCIARKP